MSDWISHWHHNSQWPFNTRSHNTIDELLREINNYLLRELQTLSHNAPENMLRTFDRPESNKVQAWGPYIYGYVTTSSDENPLIHEFGSTKPETPDGELKFNIQAINEPLLDVLTRSDVIQIVAELPGVTRQDIHLQVTGTVLTITVNSPQRQYFKKIYLPTAIDAVHASSTYTNGVLEVKLPKKNLEQSKNQSITIE